MKNKLCLLLLLVTFSNSALAEYYLVYSPPVCADCVGPFPEPYHYHSRYKPYYSHYRVRHRHHAGCHHRAHHYKRVYVRDIYRPPVEVLYREPNTCGQCETCSCNGGYAISTSQPEYYGEHCTTYEDEVQGRQDQADY